MSRESASSSSSRYRFGKIDCYGIPRDIFGRAVLKPFLRNNIEKYEAGDALVWSEITSSIRVPPRSLEHAALESTLENPRPTQLFVTSPNVEFIPAMFCDTNNVWIRSNGRYYVHDFTLYPQWYFEGTYYLPFVLRRPPAHTLDIHEWALAWYDFSLKDFVREGPGDVELGKLRQDIVDAIIAMRKKLSGMVDSLVVDQNLDPNQLNEMRHSQRGMQFASLALLVAPQSFLMTLLTVTSFQRHFLETLACYTYFKDYVPRKLSGNVNVHQVDYSLMGTFTCSLQVAQEMHQLGVPVWLVRRPAGISKLMNVGSQVHERAPDAHCDPVVFAGTVRVHFGPPSAVRNRVCQALRIKNIQIPHSAYKDMQSGDDFAPVAGLMPGVAPADQPVQIVAPPPTFSRLFSKEDINEAKFKIPGSPFMPDSSPLWVDALRRVVRDWKRIWDYPRRRTMKGYAVLDPFQIVGDKIKADRVSKTVVCWLFVRSSWLSRMTTNDADSVVFMPNPQQWRDYLVKVGTSTGLEAPRTERKNPSRKDQTTGFDQFHETLGFNGSPLDVYWGGVLVGTAANFVSGNLSLSHGTAREVVWDLFEHNWRLELLSIDRVLLPRATMTAAQRTEREGLVLEVLPRGLFVMLTPSVKDEGLAARRWEDRMEYVEAFRVLLSSWPVPGAEVLGQMSAGCWDTSSNSFRSDRSMVEGVERVAYRLYCQTFFEYTGRAPTTPFSLPRTM